MKGSFSEKIALWGVLVPLVFLGGCSVVPREIRKEADLTLSFRELRQNPEAYAGRSVLLGGEILRLDNLKEETELQVLQQPLGRRDVPIETDGSEGRFLIAHSGYLDPAVYRAGLYVTVVGEVMGATALKVGKAEQQVPVIRSKFLRMFSEPRRYYAGYYDRYYPYDPYYLYDPYYPYSDWSWWWGWPGPFFMPFAGAGFYYYGHGGHGGCGHGHGGCGHGGGGHGGGGHR
jgi:outer membrane lipoprotein